MDKGQILMDYRLAKNHKRQIPILADLNVCDTQTIVEILEEGGYQHGIQRSYLCQSQR